MVPRDDWHLLMARKSWFKLEDVVSRKGDPEVADFRRMLRAGDILLDYLFLVFVWELLSFFSVSLARWLTRDSRDVN